MEPTHESSGPTMAQLMTIIQNLSEEVRALREAATPPQLPQVDPTAPENIPLPNSSTAPIKRKPLPMGVPFDGKKASYRAWALTVSHKLVADMEFIGDSRDQYAFIWANLSSRVQGEVASTYESGGPNRNFDPNDFMAYLKFCYEDTHSREKAQATLDSLRQGKNEAFADFFPRFEQTLTQSGGDAWGDEQKL